MGFWCLPSPPFGCVVCGGVQIELWCGVKLATSVLLKETSCERLWCRPRSAIAYALLGVIWSELERDLQMAATCVGLADAWEGPSCQLQPAAAAALSLLSPHGQLSILITHESSHQASPSGEGGRESWGSSRFCSDSPSGHLAPAVPCPHPSSSYTQIWCLGNCKPCSVVKERDFG